MLMPALLNSEAAICWPVHLVENGSVRKGQCVTNERNEDTNDDGTNDDSNKDQEDNKPATRQAAATVAGLLIFLFGKKKIFFLF